jgi:uncharacterized protein
MVHVDEALFFHGTPVFRIRMPERRLCFCSGIPAERHLSDPGSHLITVAARTRREPFPPGRNVDALISILSRCGSVLVAYSGGVDSTLLGVIARDVLGERSRCAFIDSGLVSRSMADDAQATALALGLGLDVIPIPLEGFEDIRVNSPDRCRACKRRMAQALRNRADELGFSCIADGANVSDLGEYRPGIDSASEGGIIHPFIEAGITKEEIRAIAQKRGIPVWKKPSSACLASRIAYGEELTEERLGMVAAAEEYLAGLLTGHIRVRMHGTIARIEVQPSVFPVVLANRSAITRTLKSIGFTFVTLDLEGFRGGSMDEIPKGPSGKGTVL